MDEEEAESLVEFVDAKLKENTNADLKILATRRDFANTKAELIKWMFIFWMAQVVVTFGFILLFLKK
ncbi:MAG: hypothetical protein M3015_14005 [Bacteroidota bacterium]|nr:hypothetical protein [Bacteroidota bacterium]